MPSVEDRLIDSPIRAEIFGVERLEQHAESLAAAQPVHGPAAKGRALLPRVQNNGRVLRACYREIAKVIREERAITPAAEWLVDNFHIVDEQLREIRDDLPPGYYRELPKLAAGPLAGYPRVYGIAWAFVAHTDSRFDPDTLRRFVQAYQRVQPLTIGELWAVAITLRVVLVENLRRLTERIVQGRQARQAADALADDLLGFTGRPIEAMAEALRALEAGPLVTAFAVQLVQRLRDSDPGVTPALLWLNERLADQGTTPDDIVRVEHQRQAVMNVTVRNVIMSMGLLSALDWSAFFESVSLVDDILSTSAGYAAMDFPTRDTYRHAVEALARGSRRSELEIARAAVARAAEQPRQDDRGTDPGHHLIGNGRRAFESSLGFRAPLPLRLIRAYVTLATPGYLGTLLVLTLGVLAVPLLAAVAPGTGAMTFLALGLAAMIPASEVAIALLNRHVTSLLTPRALPRLELPDGVPPRFRTLVVVPTLLSHTAEIEEQIERLEVHYLANADGDVRFALLSDWTDAAAEHVPGDDDLLATAREGIARLNRRHGGGRDEGDAADGGGVTAAGDRFLLFHRRRLWNAGERRWMGWERKRGKLHELNRLLRGATDTSFLPVEDEPPTAPPDVRYVITLDADTRLPRGAVKRLVGTLAHPLNRPRLDPGSGRVVEGYGVLQPRVTPPLPGPEGSFYQRLSSGPAGIDPYAAAVSDVYQDLFGEGSYTGKGIYDVDAFEAALAGRAPENALLSHDLFEGLFARAGLVTDIELFESAPSHYGVAAARAHRWARGDWQLLPWILGGRVGVIGRWKMVDNLRRTLTAPATFLTLVLGWTLPGSAPVTLTAFVVGMIALPPLLPVVAGLFPRGHGVSKRSFARGIGRDLRLAAWQTALTVTMLAHQAWLMLDAIVRSLVRVYVTHHLLLEWVTAAQAKAGLRLDLGGFYRRMAGGVAFAAAGAGAVAWVRPAAWPVALPFLLLWAASPAVARIISLPSPAARAQPLSAPDALALRLIARRTWRFFAAFVGPAENDLPPDNFQEDPHPVVAHRTSPTNLGLYLLATMTAHDFGWIGIRDAVDRLEATLGTMGRLERHRGHFLNWYDTSDCRSLHPRYVSSVDSGNLAGHLIALQHACLQKIDQPSDARTALDGIADAALLVRESAVARAPGKRLRPKARRRLDDAVDAVMALTRVPLQPDRPPAEWEQRLTELAGRAAAVTAQARRWVEDDGVAAPAEVVVWASALEETIASHRRDLEAPEATSEPVAHRLAVIARGAQAMTAEMDFTFLFDPVRKLFAIGYRLDDASLDPGRYDLLASEARLTSFVAIAKGDVPVAHWFRLGRSLTPVEQDSALVSWSGSMFEYLMPELVMHAPSGSLLDQSDRLIVRRQISYGAERGVPWGVSESGYNARDFEQTYQYSNFGVPGLGLRRGLSEDVVITPYATGLAAMVDPTAAAQNFRRLWEAGANGAYGFYEALDYTAARLPEGAKVAVVRTYMAHHQGMLLVAVANVLLGGRMRARFHAEPIVQATELLLQERTPRDVAVARPRAEEVAAVADVREFVPPVVRRFTAPHGPVRTHILSNGRYSVMLTAAGAGYSRWGDTALTRWREDVTRDADGTHLYVRDVRSGQTWSVGYQPTGVEPDSYEMVFAEDRAKITRRDGAIATTLDVIVSSEDDAELRRVSLTNFGPRAREIELTSYAEVVLTSPAADTAHPAFSNLFVHTECAPELDALLATRRPRADGEPRVWLAHVVAAEDQKVGPLQWETDRARFLGRGRGVGNALAMSGNRTLSNTVGAVLDPIVSLRLRVRLRPGVTARITFTTLAAPTRDAALALAEKYHDAALFDRAATLAWTQAQVQMHHVGIGPDEAHLFQSLARRILYSERTLRPSADVLGRHAGGPAALWAHGISGDLPIVLVQVDEPEDVGVVRQLLRAHEYWRMKQLAVDLVILNDRAPSYVQDLQQLLETLVRTSQSSGPTAGHRAQGSVFILRADLLTPDQRDVLQAASRAVLSSRRGTLSEQIARAPGAVTAASAWPRRLNTATPAAAERLPRPPLEFFNGLGGFDADGREYVTVLEDGAQTPAPWINVIANPHFGFLVSASGAGYTWSVNSRENKLTPWSNDPVSDPPGEAIYVRDEDTGDLWGPTALPIREAGGPYIARHGQGYSRFAYAAHGISSTLVQFVPFDDPVKIGRLTLRNTSGRPRRLSVTAYVEWVLGVTRGAAAPFTVTEIDETTGAMLARNAWNSDFAGRVAFADLGGAPAAFTGDRTAFIGRNGSVAAPAELERGGRLSGRVGAGLDPCAALQVMVELGPGEEKEIVFLLGQAADRDAAVALIKRYRAVDVEAALAAVVARWDDVLGALQVRTPDRSLDLLINRWLLYQTLACRVWARSALYQAGGAYGFRDQLQDVTALNVAAPHIAREHLLRAASRQFVEGDVQHWWHAHTGRGVRTRISDDCVWLSFAVADYLAATGDSAILDEVVPFLDGPLLAADQLESYFQPQASSARATLYEHCARALDRSLAVGAHGLPLIGTGDWNDGMNAIGPAGRGESVWLGWLLHAVLGRLAPVAEARGDASHAAAWRAHALALKDALERHGWDGQWYRRAYFDDGTPLGSAANAECRIDAIAQSWAVISGAAEPSRAAQAMAAVEANLIRRDEALMLLFTPPFADAASHVDPGYIKAYPPGIRENGGQYTHAALWSVIAFAAQGEGAKAHALLSMLNPIRLASDPGAVERYKVEPYAVAADVYAEPAHVGRGGWTWYTGSAAWMYRAAVEWLLGFRVRGAFVEIDPCIPADWPGFEIAFRYGASRYDVKVENPRGVMRGIASVEVDGLPLAAGTVRVGLTDDGGTHRVRVVMG